MRGEIGRFRPGGRNPTSIYRRGRVRTGREVLRDPPGSGLAIAVELSGISAAELSSCSSGPCPEIRASSGEDLAELERRNLGRKGSSVETKTGICVSCGNLEGVYSDGRLKRHSILSGFGRVGLDCPGSRKVPGRTWPPGLSGITFCRHRCPHSEDLGKSVNPDGRRRKSKGKGRGHWWLHFDVGCPGNLQALPCPAHSRNGARR